jgi:hypothetical protein
MRGAITATPAFERRGVYSIDRLIGRHGDVTPIWLRERPPAS